MPASYELDRQRAIATLRLWGEVSGETLVEMGEALMQDPGWDETYRRLWDWRGIDTLLLELDEVKAFAQRVRENWTHAPAVAIVAQRETDLEIAHLLKAYMRLPSLGVFQSVDGALDFLQQQT